MRYALEKLTILLFVFFLSLMSTAQVSFAEVGILTSKFDALIKPHGRMSFTQGVQVGDVETLRDVILRLNNGYRVDIEEITLTPTDSETDINLKAKNLYLEPIGALLLLRSREFSYSGSELVFQQLLIGRPSIDGCRLSGAEGEMILGKFGMILENNNKADLLAEDRKFFSDEITLKHKMSGSLEACTVTYHVLTDEFGTDFGGRSGTSLKELDVILEMPGSLNTLRSVPGSLVKLSANMGISSNRIFGGALGWSFNEGNIDLEVNGRSLIKPVTYLLRTPMSDDIRFWTGLWNAGSSVSGRIDYAFTNATMRTANVLPDGLIAKFRDAGLTTMLIEASGSIESDGELVKSNTFVDITGLFRTEIDALFSPRDYPQDAQFFELYKFIPGSTTLPILIEDMIITHEDKGFLTAFESIFEVPVFVRLSQLEEEILTNFGRSERDKIRSVTEIVAEFFRKSAMEPPARLQLKSADVLDIRETSVILSKSPGAMSDLLDVKIGVKQ